MSVWEHFKRIFYSYVLDLLLCSGLMAPDKDLSVSGKIVDGSSTAISSANIIEKTLIKALLLKVGSFTIRVKAAEVVATNPVLIPVFGKQKT